MLPATGIQVGEGKTQLCPQPVCSLPPLLGEGVAIAEGYLLATCNRYVLVAEVCENRRRVFRPFRAVRQARAGHGHRCDVKLGLLDQVQERHHVVGPEVTIDDHGA
jgi:hypothetical protein